MAGRRRRKYSPKTLFGRRLRTLVGDGSYSQFERRVGLANGAVGHYLSDRSNPSIEVVQKIVQATGVDANWLLGLSDRAHRQGASVAQGVAESPAEYGGARRLSAAQRLCLETLGQAMRGLSDQHERVLNDEDYARDLAHELIQGEGVLRDIEATSTSLEETRERFFADTDREAQRRRAEESDGAQTKRRGTGKGKGG